MFYYSMARTWVCFCFDYEVIVYVRLLQIEPMSNCNAILYKQQMVH